MVLGKFGRPLKRRFGLGVKTILVVILGLCFILGWSLFSSPSSLVSSQRSSFSDIATPVAVENKGRNPHSHAGSGSHGGEESRGKGLGKDGTREGRENDKGKSHEEVLQKKVTKAAEENRETGYAKEKSDRERLKIDENTANETKRVEADDLEKENEGEGSEVEEADDQDVEIDGDTVQDEAEEESLEEKMDDEEKETKRKGKKSKNSGPLFDRGAHYTWKLCGVRSKHNYIPCIDVERTTRKVQSYRHTERSCPRTPPMCLVPLPKDYSFPVRWPESKMKILYKNVAHPTLAGYIERQSWLHLSGDHLTFIPSQSLFKGQAKHYVESIEEMAPDIEWGKNIRLVLDIGCSDVSFGAEILDKGALFLSYGLKDDLADLAQVSLERGYPAVIGSLATRQLPFPSDTFDAIHCGECRISWHHNGGKLLLEMNRILRPGGYFIMSNEHEDIEVEEAMSRLTASICWSILAHRTDEISEVSVKIYQKPSNNGIYQLRRRKNPPLCKDDANPDAVWNSPIKTCLDTIPAAIEERGSEWPEEWPKRLEKFPEWLSEKEKLTADTAHWKAIVSKSYLNGMGIDWSTVRNIMDMKAIYGGFAAALSSHNVWVMNVVPVNAPDTLPIIFERGLIGIYHDWCESFSSYPRSYDLLHADHLFSRLKHRCKYPVGIVVEMDRLVRPGGWTIIRDKVEILNPLEGILRSLHWEIRMTYAKDQEGIISAQKTAWRP